jgi:hypothetical protein
VDRGIDWLDGMAASCHCLKLRAFQKESAVLFTGKPQG